MKNIYTACFSLFLALFVFNNNFIYSEIKNNSATFKSVELEHQDKTERLSALIHADDNQRMELEKTISYIQENWDNWTQNRVFVDTVSYFRTQISEDTFITVHPNIPEVCIFTKGHTKLLGAGAFKRVDKGLKLSIGIRVAVALSHQLADFDSYDYPDSSTSYNSSYDSNPSYQSSDDYYDYYGNSYDSDFSYWSSDYYNESDSLDSSYPYQSSEDYKEEKFFDFFNGDEQEPKMLEKVQGLRGVIQIYFISYHKKVDSEKIFPIIVGKYYNGGTIYDLYISEKPVNFEERLLICHDLLLGLSEIHSRKVIHGDFHWGNALLQINPSNGAILGAYISDFGLSRICTAEICEEMHWDRAWLVNMLEGILSKVSKAEDLAKRQVVSMMLSEAINSFCDANEIYAQYIDLLAGIVDEETKERIMANSKIKKAIKLKYRNVVRWY